MSLPIVSIAGCQRSESPKSTTAEGVTKTMDIFPKIQKISDDWVMEARVINVHDWHTSFHEVRLLAFTANGTKICEAPVGDLSGHKKTVETTCSKFPSIIAATARESPCKNVNIPIVWWTSTKDKRTRTFTPGEKPWESTYQRCEEGMPPDRVLDEFETTSEDGV
jgi:hypothetical protein